MATITNNMDGTLTVTLSTPETDTVDGLDLSQLQQYLTIWLAEQAPKVLHTRFAKLSAADKADILSKMKARP